MVSSVTPRIDFAGSPYQPLGFSLIRFFDEGEEILPPRWSGY